MTRWRRIAFSALVLAFMGTSGFVCQRVADRGRFAGTYSSYGSGPKGTRALYLLAQRLGAKPQRWAQDFARLPPGAMVIALGDCESGMARKLSRYEGDELVAWVERGGVLLVAGARNYLPDKLGVSFEPEARCAGRGRFMSMEEAGIEEEPEEEESKPEQTAAPAPASGDGLDDLPAVDDSVAWTSPVDPLLDGLQAIPMRKPGRLVLEDEVTPRVLLTLPDALDMPVSPIQREAAVVVQRGRGKLIVLASGSMFQNGAIATSEGGVLFARLLRAYASGKALVFDEYHLGVGERRSLVRYLRQMGATPFALQLALVVVLLLWRFGARFGGIQVPDEPPAAGTASFVAALGNLFARAGDAAGAAQVLAKQALGRVASHHHLPLATAHRLARSLSERGLEDAAAAVRRIGEVDRMLVAEDGGLTQVSRKLDEAVARACR